MKKLAYTLSKNAITINAVFNSEEEQGLKNLIFFRIPLYLKALAFMSCHVLFAQLLLHDVIIKKKYF